MDVHRVEILRAAVLIDLLDEVKGNARHAAEQDADAWVGAFGGLVGRAQDGDVLFGVGVASPEV